MQRELSALKQKDMTAEVEVLKPGLFSSVQDAGRFGFMEYGVPVSGVMDSYAAGLANLLLKNSADAAVLEITLLGPKLRFSHATNIAITGADLSPMINGCAVENNHVLQIASGDVLSFGKRVFGARAYLAMQGEFLTEKVLNSRSWYDGITAAARLEQGMTLSYGRPSEVILPGYAAIKQDEYLTSVTVEAFPGPEFDLLSPEEKDQLQNMDFQVGKNNSRMGIQLAEPLKNNLEPILTGAVLPGTVQLTPSGTLIILMRDGQTTGGYPRVLQLSERGINTISQKVMGEKLQFSLKKYEVPS